MSAQPRIVGIVAARMTSSRLPGKVLKTVLGKSTLELMLERFGRVNALSDIVVATTKNPTDEPIVDLVKRLGFKIFRGSELDVLGRITEAAYAHKADIVVETPSDRIVLDPQLVKDCIDSYLSGGADYVSNSLVRSYPVGMDVHVFSAALLAESEQSTRDPLEREHVGLNIYRRPDRYKLRNLPAPAACFWPDLHLALDTAEDFALIKALYEHFFPTNRNFSVADIISYLKLHPEIVALNQGIKHNPSQSEYYSEVRKNPKKIGFEPEKK
jgi:spore coat polysaccharide biosynthesis protein SpsF